MLPCCTLTTQAFEVIDAVHIGMTRDIEHERLVRDRIGRAEIGDLLPFRRDRGARRDTIVAAVIEAGEDAVEVGAPPAGLFLVVKNSNGGSGSAVPTFGTAAEPAARAPRRPRQR